MIDEPLSGVRKGDKIAVRRGHHGVPEKRSVQRVTRSGRVMVESHNGTTRTFLPSGETYPRNSDPWSESLHARRWTAADTQERRRANDAARAEVLVRRLASQIGKMSHEEHRAVIAVIHPLLGSPTMHQPN